MNMYAPIPKSALSLLPTPPRQPHDPRREIRLGVGVIGVFFVGFLGWSSFARLDAAVHSSGVVRVAGNRQSVQSATAGVVSAIRVREGAHVRTGDILIEFATTETMAQERALAARVFGLQAEIARINAEQVGAATVQAPADWNGLDRNDTAAAHEALAREQVNLATERTLLASQRAVLNQRIVQTADQIGGYAERQTANTRQNALNNEELATTSMLLQKGYATKARVLALQRSGASIAGDIGSTNAEMSRLRSSIGETRLQSIQLIDARREQNTDRLRTAQTDLETALPQWRAAREQLERTRLRAPVSGTVMGLAVNTVGGVAPAGQRLADIVPDAGALVVESQVALTDANDLHAGQRVQVRIDGMQGRSLAPLPGTVSRISPDSFTDEKSGRAYYTATVTVSPAALRRASHEAGVGAIRPGTPVEVVVPLRARTALQYWLQPLTQRMSGALSEG
jgi:HlyD family secretion protein